MSNAITKEKGKKNWRGAALVLSLAGLAGLAMMSGPANAHVPLEGAGLGSVPAPEATIPGTPPPPPPPTSTNTPGPSPTPVPTSSVPPPVPTGYPTVAPCFNFVDVGTGDWYYQYVHWMACNNVIGGYPDGTFRPGNPSTRGQLTKMMVGAFRLPINSEGLPSFSDVERDNTFHSYIETAARLDIVTGYPCGTRADEPCDAQSRPYFRPNSHVTRAQITKIAVLSGQEVRPTRWRLVTPTTPTFRDVPPSDPFYSYIETAIRTDVIQGYGCGSAGEPCPGRYFRPDNNATRSQIAKVVYLAALLP